MNVLSLFDGISCAQIALERSNIPVRKYLSSEIDPYAISVTQGNYPKTLQVGDVRQLTYNDGKLYRGSEVVFRGKIDLLVGGSPCQSFSGLHNMHKRIDQSALDGKSGMYYQWLRLFYEIKPKWWLLENVVMEKKYQRIISRDLGSDPILINSSDFSAQHRERLYWTNIPVKPWIDCEVVLEQILIPMTEVVATPSLWHSVKGVSMMNREIADGRDHWDFGHHSEVDKGKSSCLLATMHKVIPQNVLIDSREASCFRYDCDFQMTEGCNGCLDGDAYQSKYISTPVIRKFSVLEAERLQRIPEHYTAISGCSNTQRYKMIGNAFTVAVVSHIFSSI